MSLDLPPRIRDRADLEALLARATNWEEKRPRSPVQPPFKLDRVAALLATVGDPHLEPRVVHVAGSKGKGTVVRLVDQVLRHAGLGPVGLYTSPHLMDLCERVAVDGSPAAGAELAAAADRILPHVRQTLDTPQAPTFFELLTAIAWLVFRERGCREVVLETGLGGRLDATNVCRPAVTAITAIELEHTDVLGDTLEAIAGEKAGILKPGVPAVTCAVEPALGVIRRRALDLGVPLAVVGEDLRVAHAASAPGPRTTVRLEFAPPAASLADLVLPVAGAHHGVNVALAAWVSRRLGVPDADLRGALAQATLPGTLEPLGGDPLVVADGAHTPASGRAARAAADACWPTHRRVLLLAFLEGKDVAGISRDLLPGAAAVVVTRLPGPRGLEAHEAARRLGPGAGPAPCVEPDCERALERARAAAGPGGLVLATGSVRLAGLVRSLVLRSRSRGG